MIASRVQSSLAAEFVRQLNALARADRMQWLATWLVRALAASLFIDSLFLAATGFGVFPLLVPALFAGPVLLFSSVAATAIMRRTSPTKIAMRADRSLGLQERIVTALEHHDRAEQGVLSADQLADTVGRLRGVRPQSAFPRRVGAIEIVALAVSIVAVSAVLVLPKPHPGPTFDKERVQQVIAQEAERVNAVAVAADRVSTVEDSATRAAIAQRLREAATAMQETDSAEKAIAPLSAAQQDLSTLQPGDAGELQQALARAAEGLRTDAATRAVGGRLARGDTEGAAAALHGIGDNAASLSDAQRSRVAQALHAAAEGAGSAAGNLAQSLEQASNALNSPNGAQRDIQAALNKAADDVQQAGQTMAEQDLIEKALSQLQDSKSAIANSSGAGDSGRTPLGNAEKLQKPAISDASAGGEQPTDSHDSAARSASARGGPENQGNQQGSGQDGQQGESGGSGVGTGSVHRQGTLYDPKMAGQALPIDDGRFDRPSVSASDFASTPDPKLATIDYRDVFAEYRDQASAAVQDRYIPLELKNLVKDYFSSLDSVN